MFYISWGPAYEIGIAEIDGHHRHLICIYNDLVAAVEMGGGPVVVEDTLTRLAEYTKFHFAREEQLMATYGCPNDKLEAHGREHAALLDKLESLIRRASSEPSWQIGNKTLRFLGSWLVDHTQGTDRECARLLTHPGTPST